jgi:hypothetical protein
VEQYQQQILNILEQTEKTPCLAQLLVWAADMVVLLLLPVIPEVLEAAAVLVLAHRGQLQVAPVQQDKETTVDRVELTLHRFRLEVAAELAQSARQPQTH